MSKEEIALQLSLKMIDKGMLIHTSYESDMTKELSKNKVDN